MSRSRRLKTDERRVLCTLMLRIDEQRVFFETPLRVVIGPATRQLMRRRLVRFISRTITEDCSACIEMVALTLRGVFVAHQLLERPRPW